MKKTLVAYFSASGTTAAVAKTLAEAAGADLYEIKPQTAYTHADLDWTNKKSTAVNLRGVCQNAHKSGAIIVQLAN